MQYLVYFSNNSPLPYQSRESKGAELWFWPLPNLCPSVWYYPNLYCILLYVACRCSILSVASKKTTSWQFLLICNSKWLIESLLGLLKSTVCKYCTWKQNCENINSNWEVFFGYVQIVLSALYTFRLLQINEKLMGPFHFVNRPSLYSFCEIYKVTSVMSEIKCLFFLIADLRSLIWKSALVIKISTPSSTQ